MANPGRAERRLRAKQRRRRDGKQLDVKATNRADFISWMARQGRKQPHRNVK